MKYYPYWILFSTLFCCLHFFVGNNALAWQVWDYTNAFAGFSVLPAILIYSIIPFHKIGLKLYAAIYAVLNLICALLLVINHDQRTTLVPISVLVITLLFILIKASHWDLNAIKEWRVKKLEPAEFYVVFKRPHSFITWIGSIFGYGMGSLYVVHGGSKFYMSQKLKKFAQKYHNGELRPDEIAFNLNVSDSDRHWFRNFLRRMENKPFLLLKSNCLTSLSEGFAEIGVKPKTFLPSLYFRVFLRRGNRG